MIDEFIYIMLRKSNGREWDYRDKRSWVDYGGNKEYYNYDAEGNRTRKVTEKRNIIETRYYINGFELFRREVNGQIGYERTTVNVADGEKIFARIETMTGERPLVRYQYDNHLGSACLELDDGANIISYEEYHPFGTTSYRSGRDKTEVSFKRYKYCGKERDEQTGLYYYGARYYASWICRFISVDPHAYKYPSLSPYVYCADNPVKYIDPDGMEFDGWEINIKTGNTKKVKDWGGEVVQHIDYVNEKGEKVGGTIIQGNQFNVDKNYGGGYYASSGVMPTASSATRVTSGAMTAIGDVIGGTTMYSNSKSPPKSGNGGTSNKNTQQIPSTNESKTALNSMIETGVSLASELKNNEFNNIYAKGAGNWIGRLAGCWGYATAGKNVYNAYANNETGFKRNYEIGKAALPALMGVVAGGTIAAIAVPAVIIFDKGVNWLNKTVSDIERWADQLPQQIINAH